MQKGEKTVGARSTQLLLETIIVSQTLSGTVGLRHALSIMSHRQSSQVRPLQAQQRPRAATTHWHGVWAMCWPMLLGPLISTVGCWPKAPKLYDSGSFKLISAGFNANLQVQQLQANSKPKHH
jgi:hypothetical protein